MGLPGRNDRAAGEWPPWHSCDLSFYHGGPLKPGAQVLSSAGLEAFSARIKLSWKPLVLLVEEGFTFANMLKKLDDVFSDLLLIFDIFGGMHGFKSWISKSVAVCELEMCLVTKGLCPFLYVLMSLTHNNAALIDGLLERLFPGQPQQIIKGLL